jgi:hypothetical protein
MDAIKEAITSLVVEQPQTAAEAESASVEAKLPDVIATPEAEVPVASAPSAVEGAVAAAPPVEDEDTEAPPAFIDEEPVPVAPRRQPARPPVRREVKPPAPAPEPEPQAAVVGQFDNVNADDDNDDSDGGKGGKKGKKGKNRRRELVFDERRGEVVSKRKRKGGRSRDWGDFEE